MWAGLTRHRSVSVGWTAGKVKVLSGFPLHQRWSPVTSPCWCKTRKGRTRQEESPSWLSELLPASQGWGFCKEEGLVMVPPQLVSQMAQKGITCSQGVCLYSCQKHRWYCLACFKVSSAGSSAFHSSSVLLQPTLTKLRLLSCCVRAVAGFVLKVQRRQVWGFARKTTHGYTTIHYTECLCAVCKKHVSAPSSQNTIIT